MAGNFRGFLSDICGDKLGVPPYNRSSAKIFCGPFWVLMNESNDQTLAQDRIHIACRLLVSKMRRAFIEPSPSGCGQQELYSPPRTLRCDSYQFPYGQSFEGLQAAALGYAGRCLHPIRSVDPDLDQNQQEKIQILFYPLIGF